ncbi:hypothetical protein HJA82_28870 [Rhizobium bangladeshense]|uniref:hypothetical protein n=1 Tax=Rhizobium bangladeshense TaxID=1138189 RepID=UPI001C83F9C8|nr:hypothetical protein [Rhizobium bangladeshense]MBX4911326.1 hypothetical protein [Rhizobium bangladeshense]
MTDWNADFEKIITRDNWRNRFNERWPNTTPEVRAGYTELASIESNVATVRLLTGKYEAIYQIPFVNNSVRLSFIRPRRLPFHIPDFLITLSYIVSQGGLQHEKGTNEYEPVTVEEATRLVLEELKHLL